MSFKLDMPDVPVARMRAGSNNYELDALIAHLLGYYIKDGALYSPGGDMLASDKWSDPLNALPEWSTKVEPALMLYQDIVEGFDAQVSGGCSKKHPPQTSIRYDLGKEMWFISDGARVICYARHLPRALALFAIYVLEMRARKVRFELRFWGGDSFSVKKGEPSVPDIQQIFDELYDAINFVEQRAADEKELSACISLLLSWGAWWPGEGLESARGDCPAGWRSSGRWGRAEIRKVLE